MKHEERQLLLYSLKHKLNENGELLKQCSICDEWFPCTEEHFYKNKSNHKDGLHPYCKQCTIKKSTIRMNNNWEEHLASLRVCSAKPKARVKKRKNAEVRRLNGKYGKWQQDNPEKMKQYRLKRGQNKTHTISKKEWEDCQKYFNNTCAYCGLPIEEHFIKFKGKIILGNFHKEHVDHEGVNDLSNCIPACKECNCLKWVYKFEEWYNEDNVGFTKERMDKIHKWINGDYKLYIKVRKDDEIIDIKEII